MCPVALHDGWGQPKATEANPEEMHTEDKMLGSEHKGMQIRTELHYSATLAHVTSQNLR